MAEMNSRSVIMEIPVLRKSISEESPVTPSVMAPFATNLDDMFISVKTTKHYHHSRLPAIVDTWFQFARNQVSLYAVLIAVKSRYLGFISVARSHFLRFNFATTSFRISCDHLKILTFSETIVQ